MRTGLHTGVSVPMELAAYLVAVPRDTLDALYESRWTCLAVLRSLPPLGAQYVLRMLLVDAPITQGTSFWHLGRVMGNVRVRRRVNH